MDNMITLVACTMTIFAVYFAHLAVAHLVELRELSVKNKPHKEPDLFYCPLFIPEPEVFYFR